MLANAALTRVQYYSGDPAFLATAERTVALDPNNPEMLAATRHLLSAYGDATHGTELVARALKLSPQGRAPDVQSRLCVRALAGGRWLRGAAVLAHKLDAPKWFISHMVIAAAAGLCGDKATAAEARARLLALSPQFEADLPGLIAVWRFDPRLHSALLKGLRKAGFDLPDAAQAK